MRFQIPALRIWCQKSEAWVPKSWLPFLLLFGELRLKKTPTYHRPWPHFQVVAAGVGTATRSVNDDLPHRGAAGVALYAELLEKEELSKGGEGPPPAMFRTTSGTKEAHGGVQPPR